LIGKGPAVSCGEVGKAPLASQASESNIGGGIPPGGGGSIPDPKPCGFWNSVNSLN